MLLLSFRLIAYNPICPPEPEAEEHEVKEIFEKVFVQEIKPLWMMLYGNGYQGDTQDVKKVRAREAQGDKP